MKFIEKPNAPLPKERARPGLINTRQASFRRQRFMKLALCAVTILVCFLVAMAQQTSELYGWVKDSNQSPAQGVVLTMGNYSVATDRNGYYKITFLKPGSRTISITPPGRATRSKPVKIDPKPTRFDVKIDW
jgi:hypothetical protein